MACVNSSSFSRHCAGRSYLLLGIQAVDDAARLDDA
jgi:hypothetical protein